LAETTYHCDDAGGDAWRAGGVATPPATEDPGVETDYTSGEETTVSTDDNNYGPSQSASGAYHRFQFPVAEATGTIDQIDYQIKFKGDGPVWGSDVKMFVWNSNSSSYELLDTQASPGQSTKYTLDGTTASNPGYYVDGSGQVTAIVQVQGGGSKMSFYIAYAEVVVTYTATAPEIALSGNGQNIANGDVTPSPSDHTDFGDANVASGTVDRTFTVTNSGDAALNLSGTPKVALSGTHSADFSVTSQPSSPVAISGGTTTFTVEFDPSATGTRSATISIANDDADENPFTFAIQGEGVAPEIALSGNGQNIPNGDVTPSPSDHTDFGDADVGSGTVDRTFTETNSGDGALSLTGTPKVALSGTHSADFSVTAQPSSPVAISGGTTTFTVEFDPSATGTRSATISIDNDDSDEDPFTFAIQGTGIMAEIDIRGNSISIANGDVTPILADGTNFGDVSI